MEKIFTIKEASKILGISIKTLYARANNDNYKQCFYIMPDLRKSFLYYRKACIDEELNNRITNKDKSEFTDFYYSVIKILTNGNLSDFDKCDEAEKELSNLIKELLKKKDKEGNIDYFASKIIDCNPTNRKELIEFQDILTEIKTGLNK